MSRAFSLLIFNMSACFARLLLSLALEEISGFLKVLATMSLVGLPKLLRLDSRKELRALEASLPNEAFEAQSLMTSQKSSPPLAAAQAVVFLGQNSVFELCRSLRYCSPTAFLLDCVY